MNNPIISIVVPCYNGEKYLRETLDCLQKQTIEDWECVIVNDGSTDGSLEIMKEYASKDDRYKYIDKINEGPAIARNTAITASAGKYILPLDADDLIDPSYTEKAINYLEEHKSTKLVYCKAEFFGDINEPFDLKPYNYNDLPYENPIFCSCIYRRTDYDETTGYNPNMNCVNEDWDFLLSLLNKDDDVFCIPEVLFFYRRHGKTRNDSNSEKYFSSLLRMVLNHPEKYETNVIRTLDFLNWKKDYYECKINAIKNSKSYRISHFLKKLFI